MNAPSTDNSEVLPRVLVVDDDEQILKQIRWALADDYSVFAANDRESALSLFREERTPVVLLDLGLPPRPREADEGLLALEAMLAENPLAKIIVVSGNSERRNAVEAIQKGAFDIFPKPVDLDQLKVVLQRVHQRLQLESESAAAGGEVDEVPDGFQDIVGGSPGMKKVFHTVDRVAATEVSILITGESGTGKECIANAIHQKSGRRQGPFVAINCGAIPENLLESELFGHEKGAFTGATGRKRGKLEYAQGGTLFLDEIGELEPALQVKLLRFLQERVLERVGGREVIAVDARVLAATNQDLEAAVRAGTFREDLYFRLAVVKVGLPPLRERGHDVEVLAEHFSLLYASELKKRPRKFSKKALAAMSRHDWPGNVRELQNRVKRAIVLCDSPTIEPADLELQAPSADPVTRETSLREAKESLERDLVSKALTDNGWNISRAARTLGVSRPTLYDLIARYQLKEES